MKDRTSDQITKDLVSIGVDPTKASIVAQGAHLRGILAGEFAESHASDVQLTINQQIQLMSVAVQPSITSIRSLLTIPLNQSQFDSLVEFKYNTRDDQFISSRMLGYLNSGNFAAAFPEWIDFSHSNSMLNQGLLNRNNHLINIFQGGQYRTK